MRHMIWALLVVCCAAWSLAPQEVLVVANTKSEESVKLAEHYLQVRRIPRENLCLISTGTGYHCTRAEYETEICVPVRNFLVKEKLAGKIRCIVLMWGVPVKIGWQPFASAYPELLKTYEASGETTLRTFSQVKLLLDSVGKTFPAAKGEDLTRLETVFETLPELPQYTLPNLEDQTAEGYSKRVRALDAARLSVQKLMYQKKLEVEKIADPAQRAIAERQLLAIHFLVKGRYEAKTDLAGGDEASYTKAQQQARDTVNAIRVRMRWEAPDPALVKTYLAAVATEKGLIGLVYAYGNEMNPASYRDAAVDNELALLWYGNYPLGNMQGNPLHWKARQDPAPEGAVLPNDVAWPAFYMTARIDGPTAADAKRMIDDAVAVEQTGLTGTVYLDAGGKFESYDIYFKKLAALLTKETTLKVVLDEQKTLFAPNSCPDAALYVGWYSLCNYIPAFTWNKGAVGYHIASYEASDLRNPMTKEWCAKMIQHGVAATMGPVSEPYLTAFPFPEDFFSLLLTGKYTLAECYWRTQPCASWQMTLIGDPLYTPYKVNPQLTVDKLQDKLAP